MPNAATRVTNRTRIEQIEPELPKIIGSRMPSIIRLKIRRYFTRLFVVNVGSNRKSRPPFKVPSADPKACGRRLPLIRRLLIRDGPGESDGTGK